ncbi:MAG TPA: hypothetical protein VF595_14490 [Tepidisphaeraceae bacterium]|jgi:hypothetical protein
MAGYIPYFQKKLLRLTEQEQRLTELIAGNASAAELLDVAEQVRAARVRAIRSKQAELPPSERNAAQAKQFAELVQQWLGLSSEAIVEVYRLPERQRSAAARKATA